MRTQQLQINERKMRRARRTRARLHGTAACPRLSVSRSLQHISAQLIDDETGKTLVSVHDREVDNKLSRTEKAHAAGMLLAQKSHQQKITKVVFDRGSYAYHGRVQALADGAREKGLVF